MILKRPPILDKNSINFNDFSDNKPTRFFGAVESTISPNCSRIGGDASSNIRCAVTSHSKGHLSAPCALCLDGVQQYFRKRIPNLYFWSRWSFWSEPHEVRFWQKKVGYLRIPTREKCTRPGRYLFFNYCVVFSNFILKIIFNNHSNASLFWLAPVYVIRPCTHDLPEKPEPWTLNQDRLRNFLTCPFPDAFHPGIVWMKWKITCYHTDIHSLFTKNPHHPQR